METERKCILLFLTNIYPKYDTLTYSCFPSCKEHFSEAPFLSRAFASMCFSCPFSSSQLRQGGEGLGIPAPSGAIPIQVVILFRRAEFRKPTLSWSGPSLPMLSAPSLIHSAYGASRIRVVQASHIWVSALIVHVSFGLHTEVWSSSTVESVEQTVR